jgi:uncharacterized membrane protein
MTEEPKHKHELYEKLKTLSLEELKGYERAAISSRRFIGLIAVSSIFGALITSSTLVMIVAGIFVYILGNVSVGMTNTLTVIREQILKSEKT